MLLTTTSSDTSWVTLAPGLEQRLYFPNPANPLVQIAALRIDPALYTFRVHYRPGEPLTLQGWLETLPGVVAFVNGNFFDGQGQALGMVIADGAIFGQSYTERGGTFLVQNGQPLVRSNILEPYQGEPFEQAIQAFPMLVTDGQPSYTNRADRDVSRRTVVAQDSSGRVILLATPLVGMTLADLASYLPTTDLHVMNALNLDGGGSTLLYAGVGDTDYTLRSFDAVPVVLAVYAR